MSESPPIQFVPPRSTIEIHLPDDQVISGPRGAAIVGFFDILEGYESTPIVGAVINGQLKN